MDPKTALLIATLMMLLNGGVLGLMHRDLPESLRQSAVSWRIATLLQAGGVVLLAVQEYLPPWFVLPIGNLMILLGLTGYWYALRQFYGLPGRAHMLLPTLFGTAAVTWYAVVDPDLSMRISAASLAWVYVLMASALTLRNARNDRAMSRRVLASVFLVVSVFMLARFLYFLTSTDVSGTLLDSSNHWNVLTPMVAAILPVIGTTGFLLLCSDRIRRDWEHAASTDYLTGLANRRTLANQGEQRLRRACLRGEALALAVIDIDHFKSINDRFGHDIGDQVLRQVADRIAQACTPADLAARQGGEEFALLLGVRDLDSARQRAETLRAVVAAEPLAPNGQPIAVSVSIGLTLAKPEDETLDQLLRRADHALYAAKAAGRNRVICG
ncbi:MAG: GGDEF domain-containing protein [Lysobacterales bacterium]